MKKIFPILIFIALISTTVLAGEIHRLDFNKNPLQVEEVKEGDLVEMGVGNRTHKLILKRVITDKSIINVALFVEGTDTPTYISLGYNQKARLDFYNDRKDDMSLVLESLSTKNARIIFRTIDETENPLIITNETNKETAQISGEIVKEITKDTPNLKTGIIIATCIIIIGLIATFLFLKK